MAPMAMTTSLLCPDAFLSPIEIDAAVTRALAEDLGRAGDVTSTATIPEDARARAVVVAREAGVIAGLPLVAATLLKLAPDVEIAATHRDGARVAARTALMTVAGPSVPSSPPNAPRSTSCSDSVGNRDPEARKFVRGCASGYRRPKLLGHAKDDPGWATSGEIRGAHGAAARITAWASTMRS